MAMTLQTAMFHYIYSQIVFHANTYCDDGLVQSLWFLKHHRHWVIPETCLRYPAVVESWGDLLAGQGVRRQEQGEL